VGGCTVLCLRSSLPPHTPVLILSPCWCKRPRGCGLFASFPLRRRRHVCCSCDVHFTATPVYVCRCVLPFFRRVRALPVLYRTLAGQQRTLAHLFIPSYPFNSLIKTLWFVMGSAVSDGGRGSAPPRVSAQCVYGRRESINSNFKL
jgi:hypothetical protein